MIYLYLLGFFLTGFCVILHRKKFNITEFIVLIVFSLFWPFIWVSSFIRAVRRS